MVVKACWRKVQLPCEVVLQTSEAEPVTEATTLARMGESKSEPVQLEERQVSTLGVRCLATCWSWMVLTLHSVSSHEKSHGGPLAFW